MEKCSEITKVLAQHVLRNKQLGKILEDSFLPSHSMRCHWCQCVSEVSAMSESCGTAGWGIFLLLYETRCHRQKLWRTLCRWENTMNKWVQLRLCMWVTWSKDVQGKWIFTGLKRNLSGLKGKLMSSRTHNCWLRFNSERTSSEEASSLVMGLNEIFLPFWNV